MAAMVRGLRENPNDAQFLSQTLAEIKRELGSTNMSVKANAFLKLGYLSMMGVDLSIAQMPIIEVMSSGNFLLKRPAMFVASLAFKDQSELALLTTNIFLKELRSPNVFEVSSALSCLSCICTSDIADGVSESLALLATHSKPIVRKKTALCMFRVCEKSPSQFATLLPKLKDLLVDADQTVQSAAVASLLEFGNRNSRLAVPLIPVFFHLLKEIKNNWIVIKLLRLMHVLCKTEPRLWSKLVSTNVLMDLVAQTKAKSVQVEFCRFVLTLDVDKSVEESEEQKILISKAVEFLLEFLESPDNNIRCIALGITGVYMKTAPKDHESFTNHVLQGVDSIDSTMRAAALRAVPLLKESPEHVIQQLLSLFTKHDGQKNIQLELVGAILDIGAQRDLKDTEWYLRILILLGSDSCMDTVTSNRIAIEFKRVVAQKDPSVAVNVAVAALVGKKTFLPPRLAGVCAWTLGELGHAHWPSSGVSVEQVVDLVLKKAAKSESSTEAQIDMVWGATKLVVSINTDQGRKLAQSLIEEIETFPSSIALNQVCSVCVGLLGVAASEDVTDILFKKHSDVPIKVPDNLHEPLIQLPASLQVDPRSFSTAEDDNVVYTDTEEEQVPAGGKEAGDLFSIDSVLNR